MSTDKVGERIRVRGLVQGVGFRPAVWRLARDGGLAGSVCNDAHGVLIEAWGEPVALQAFVAELTRYPPPLARIDRIEREPLRRSAPELRGGSAGFVIAPSAGGDVHTTVLPDAAACAECLAECLDPDNRRHRYPFTNCTHCGPRISIVRGIPYDRTRTSMAAFELCRRCRAEYADPGDRRFHAQANACPDCGPSLTLEGLGGARLPETTGDLLDTVVHLLECGRVVAIKGIGGYHLACDATSDAAVQRLRRAKLRPRKPFAMMARSIAVVRDYCRVSGEEADALESAAAPIVLLQKIPGRKGSPAAIPLSEAIAPGQSTLGFMLPYTPLHALIMAAFDRPLVLTSGNPSGAPQLTEDDEARCAFTGLADGLLGHDRTIVNRVDDSVVRASAGRVRLIRLGRGYAPASLTLPPGFERARPLIAFGGELKNTFCLVKDGRALMSQHMGNLEHAAAFADYRRNLGLYQQLFAVAPECLAVDLHPDYLSSKLGREQGREHRLPVVDVQHHHAHLASCLAENGVPRGHRPVLGVALDGLGYGADGALWGGEWLLCDYQGYRRLGALADVALPGGSAAIREPWRNLVAHLAIWPGWEVFLRRFGHLPVARRLSGKPVETLRAMIGSGFNAPLTSACGRWFDAAAALLGIAPDRIGYEAEAALELETLAGAALPASGYPLQITERDGLLRLLPARLWPGMLEDVDRGAEASTIAARFHRGLADGVVAMTRRLCEREHLAPMVALSGGVFQNSLLLEAVTMDLRQAGFQVLTQHRVPGNDGGLALGQAVVAAARALEED